MKIISMLKDHWPAVKAIYESGIATGQATFQTSAVIESVSAKWVMPGGIVEL